MNIDQVAVQLYTLRELTAQDMLGTLRQLAAIGYRAVELAGYGNSAPQDIRATLDDVGVRAVAAHVGLQQLQQDPDTVLADLHILGCDYLVVPWVSEEYRGSREQVLSLAQQLNEWGRRVSAHGLRLGYHNHQFEFAPLDGSTMWEILAAATDPALIDLELDVFWAVEGGFDPLDLLQRYGQRLSLLHLKDRSREPGGTDAPVGTGSLPWQQILAAADTAGTKWYIVEQDHPGNPLDDVRRSFEQLRAWS